MVRTFEEMSKIEGSSNVEIVDTRPENMYEAAHIAGAKNVPMKYLYE